MRSLRWSAFVSWMIVAGLAIGGFAAFSPRPASDAPTTASSIVPGSVGDDAGRVAAAAFISSSLDLSSSPVPATGAQASGSDLTTPTTSLVQGREGPVEWPSGATCEASWYGPGFEGRETANGEFFDPQALTGALHDVPFGTRVVVTRLDTRASVIVRINDRGPYEWHDGWFRHPTRCIDLSRAAMEALGGVGDGVVPVTIDY